MAAFCVITNNHLNIARTDGKGDVGKRRRFGAGMAVAELLDLDHGAPPGGEALIVPAAGGHRTALLLLDGQVATLERGLLA